MSPKIPVFFDVDNTLVEGQTQQILIRYLYRKGKVSFFFFLKIFFWFLLYKLHLVKNVSSIREKSFKRFAGWKVAEFNTIVKECFEKEIRPRIFPQSLKLIQQHMKENYEVILTSASLSNVTELLRQHIGTTFAISTKLGVKEDLLTGKGFWPNRLRRE